MCKKAGCPSVTQICSMEFKIATEMLLVAGICMQDSPYSCL